jgi:two-component system, OmpR family, phosphate regulon sensor histidine kinase PhoR
LKKIHPLLLLSVLVIIIYATEFVLLHKFFVGNQNWFQIVLILLFPFILLLLLVYLLFVKKINFILHYFKTNNASDLEINVPPAKFSNPIENLNQEISAWTENRKAEIERLKKLEVYRKEFLGNVSHELKTPVFNIQGYILTLLDGGLEDPTINRNYLQRAEKSVDRMITIIDDLEAISQLETGELRIESEKFDIISLIKDVIEAQEMKATARGIKLIAVGDSKPIMVYADRFRIRQVLVNLIVNSIKYGKQNGETKIKVNDLGNKILVEVSDNGMGVSKEHLPRLFERFYRVDKSRSREQGGTGLGLAIVKHIIEAHSQTIQVMSTEEVGTVFTFSLAK